MDSVPTVLSPYNVFKFEARTYAPEENGRSSSSDSSTSPRSKAPPVNPVVETTPVVANRPPPFVRPPQWRPWDDVPKGNVDEEDSSTHRAISLYPRSSGDYSPIKDRVAQQKEAWRARWNQSQSDDESDSEQSSSSSQASRQLDFSGRFLTSVPKEAYSFAAVTSLNLSNNRLTEIPASFDRLILLEELYLQGNNLAGTYQTSFQFLLRTKNLRVLDISYNGLKDVPIQLRSCVQLEVLHLSHNELQLFPQNIFKNLTNLKELYLEQNRLTNISDEISYLTSLTTLSLFNNCIAQIDHRLRFPASLQFLDLSANNLAYVHPCHFLAVSSHNWDGSALGASSIADQPFDGLHFLDISKNKIAYLDEEMFLFGRLMGLRELRLSDNYLQELPQSLGHLQNLSVLTLNSNRIHTLPITIGELVSLDHLYLAGNLLRTLPNSLGKLRQLQFLDLSDNQLEILPRTLAYLSSVQQLKLRNNRLMALPFALHMLKPNLRNLDVLDNPLQDPPLEVLEKGTEAILQYLEKAAQNSLEDQEEWFIVDPTPKEQELIFYSEEDRKNFGMYNPYQVPKEEPSASNDSSEDSPRPNPDADGQNSGWIVSGFKVLTFPFRWLYS